MISFTINLEVVSRVGPQCNDALTEKHEMQWRDPTIVKTNDSKSIILFEVVGSIKSTSKIEHISGIQKYP